jgi:acetolactate synthase-1/3 small subunit
VVVELTGTEHEVESFIEMVRPHGIVEMVRTGVVAMARSEHSNDCTLHPSAWAAAIEPRPLSVV